MASVNYRSQCKPTRLIARTGLVCLALIGSRSCLGQQISFARIDSLVQRAVEIQYADFHVSDSLYDVAGKQLDALGSGKNPLLKIHIQHLRATGALFHNRIGSAKQFITETYATINEARGTLGPLRDSLKAQTGLFEANYFYVVGNYPEALEKFNDAESFFAKDQRSPLVCGILYSILQFQASIYQLQGELESCIDRHLASRQYLDCSISKNDFRNHILIYRNIGLAYAKMGNASRAREYFFAAKANLDSCQGQARNDIVRNNALVLYNSLGEFYRNEKKLDSAKYYFLIALSMVKDNSNFASRVNEGLAKVAVSQHDFITANRLFSDALEQTIRLRGEKHYLTANLYRQISTMYQEQRDLQNSLIYIQKSLFSLSSEDELSGNYIESNPALRTLSIQKETVMTLHQKAAILTSGYLQQHEKRYLDAARATSMLAIQLIDSTRNEFNLEKDKVVLVDEATKVYQTGLHLASLFYQLTHDPQYVSECFELMDKSKSAVLTDHVKQVKSFSRLPKDLLSRQRELKVELAVAEQQLYAAEIKKLESSPQRQRLGEIKQAYATLLNDIRVAAPSYYKLRVENKKQTIEATQKMLSANEVLVEYFLGDSILYTLAITSREFKLFTIKADSIREHIESLRNVVATPGLFAKADQQREWSRRAKLLYQTLISPWRNEFSRKNVVIIPHDQLNYLPFELLQDPSSGEILLTTASISYASSANLLAEQKSMNPQGDFFAAFHADYSNQPNLAKLPGALHEVSAIKGIFGFRSSLFAAATAEDFRRQASKYKIIHLALHSLVNDDKPLFSRLVFTQVSDSIQSDITANELYSMELNAEIAVLSACETGLGKLHRGEGMMSLSRAFMYAGVPSTVISLWEVPDQSASILMTKFYQSLKNGYRKDEALQRAKLEFIAENPEMSHPFFWAGFVINGKTDPLSFSYFSTLEMVSAAIIGLLAVTVVAIGRRRRNRLAL